MRLSELTGFLYYISSITMRHQIVAAPLLQNNIIFKTIKSCGLFFIFWSNMSLLKIASPTIRGNMVVDLSNMI